MAYDCRTYSILIASPSDVTEEREIAVKVIQEWNDLNSYSRKVVLLPLRWETHTAPEYGTRPQEVINQSIVDHCDLLVGIFWTRIGTPTGESESGTLEEINRVGKAAKPIMLYFSKIGIDPDRLDFDQVRQLKEFKEKTYPNSLTESYKTMIDFRDKFSKQLELKIRELQKADETRQSPLLISFYSIEKEKPIGNQMAKVVKQLVLNNSLESLLSQKKYKYIKDAKNLLDVMIKEELTVPIVLSISNISAYGIRNLYVELFIQTENTKVEVTEFQNQWGLYSTAIGHYLPELQTSFSKQNEKTKLALLWLNGLIKKDNGWKYVFEWEALQPQLTRIIKPAFNVTSPEAAIVKFTTKIYSDSFPQPVTLDAKLDIEVKEENVELEQLFPDFNIPIRELR